jgi:hypothetical protein
MGNQQSEIITNQLEEEKKKNLLLTQTIEKMTRSNDKAMKLTKSIISQLEEKELMEQKRLKKELKQTDRKTETKSEGYGELVPRLIELKIPHVYFSTMINDGDKNGYYHKNFIPDELKFYGCQVPEVGNYSLEFVNKEFRQQVGEEKRGGKGEEETYCQLFTLTPFSHFLCGDYLGCLDAFLKIKVKRPLVIANLCACGGYNDNNITTKNKQPFDFRTSSQKLKELDIKVDGYLECGD